MRLSVKEGKKERKTESKKERKKEIERINKIFNARKEMFYLTTHSTHFIYGYMASDIIIMVKD